MCTPPIVLSVLCHADISAVVLMQIAQLLSELDTCHCFCDIDQTVPYVMQAAVSAAAAAVLRHHAASPQQLEAAAVAFPEREPQQIVCDCVRALCQWRDDVAREEDEGAETMRMQALTWILLKPFPLLLPPALSQTLLVVYPTRWISPPKY